MEEEDGIAMGCCLFTHPVSSKHVIFSLPVLNGGI